MSSRITAIRARLGAATPGPWHMGPSQPDHPTGDARMIHVTQGGADAYVAQVFDDGGESQRDADFIAHAPADIAWLLDELERVYDYVYHLNSCAIVTENESAEGPILACTCGLAELESS